MARRSLFAELRRRNVLRAAAIYIAAVWALAQGIAQLAPAFGGSDWWTRWFVVACALGFPFWVVFAWYYEWTPQGFRREREIDAADPVPRGAGRKRDWWIFGAMAAAIVLLATNQFVVRRDATSGANRTDATAWTAKLANVAEQSVAVLPFFNESDDPEQAYFSDGLSEELITNLTQIAGLKVIGKYSSFQFRGSRDTPAQIGATLGVANLVDGSVRQSGNHLRITVNLIRALDGSAIWSQRYDRELQDVFAIQSEIGRAVADALKIKLVGATLADQQQPPGGSVEAYQLMLQGRAQTRRATQADFEQGLAALEKAVQLDPGYAYAWSLIANTRINLATYFLVGEARQRSIERARMGLDRAAAAAPDASFVHRARGNLLSRVDNDPAGALVEMRRALAVTPQDGVAMAFLADALAGAGQPEPAAELLHQAIATDPLRADWYVHLSTALVQLGRFDEAERGARQAVAVQSRNPGHYLNLSHVLAARGRFDAAEQAAREAVALQPDDPANRLQLAAILDDRGATEAAVRSVRATLAEQPGYPGAHAQLTRFELRRDDAAAALRAAQQETDPRQKAWALAAALQLGTDTAAADAALDAYLAEYGAANPDYMGVATLYGLRKQPDAMFQWLERGVAGHDLSVIGTLLQDSLLFPFHGDPRFIALCRRLGLPAPGDAAHAAVPPA